MTIQTGRYTVIPAGIMDVQVRAPATGIVLPWWTGLTIAHQPKGASDYAASKVNLVNPGMYDSVDGVAFPSWSAATGWTFNGTTQYLLNAARVDTAWTVLVQIMGGGTGIICGVASYQSFYMWSTAGNLYLVNNVYGPFSPAVSAGNLCIAGQRAYKNGLFDTNLPMDFYRLATANFAIGAANTFGGGAVLHWSGTITALGMSSTTLTAPQVLRLANAMAAI